MHRPENAVGPYPKVGYVSPIGLNPYPNHFTDALGPPPLTPVGEPGGLLHLCKFVASFLMRSVLLNVTYAYVIEVMFMKSSRLGTMLRAREATRPEVLMCEGRPNEDGMQRRGNMQDDATKMDDDELMLDGVGTRSMKRLTRTMTVTTR